MSLPTKSRTILALAAAFALAACAVSDSEEAALGRDYAAQIDSQVPLVRDAAVNAYIDSLGRAIASHTSRRSLQWRFAIVNASEVNAFALPGGYIYVNRGLIERADRMEHLAGVLGHEIGHVVERHSIEQLKKKTRTGVGVSVICNITDLCSSDLSRVVINVAGSALFAKYSRADEAEADSQAVVNVVNAGIDPHGIPELFQVLIAERRRSPNLFDTFFATHPLEESRVERTRALLSALEPRANGLATDDPGYHLFKQRLAALPYQRQKPPGAP